MWFVLALLIFALLYGYYRLLLAAHKALLPQGKEHPESQHEEGCKRDSHDTIWATSYQARIVVCKCGAIVENSP